MRKLYTRKKQKKHEKHETHTTEQKQKRQHFYVHKKQLRGGKLLV